MYWTKHGSELILRCDGQPNPIQLPTSWCSSWSQCGLCCILWELLECWWVLWSQRIFIPLPLGKPHLRYQVYLDLCLLNCWHKSGWTSLSGSGLARGTRYDMHWCSQSHTPPGPIRSPPPCYTLSLSSAQPTPLCCLVYCLPALVHTFWSLQLAPAEQCRPSCQDYYWTVATCFTACWQQPTDRTLHSTSLNKR